MDVIHHEDYTVFQSFCSRLVKDLSGHWEHDAARQFSKHGQFARLVINGQLVARYSWMNDGMEVLQYAQSCERVLEHLLDYARSCNVKTVRSPD